MSDKPKLAAPKYKPMLYDIPAQHRTFENADYGSIADYIFKMALRQRLQYYLAHSHTGELSLQQDGLRQYAQYYEVPQPYRMVNRARPKAKSAKNRPGKYNYPTRKVMRATNQKSDAQVKRKPAKTAKKDHAKKYAHIVHENYHIYYAHILYKQEAFIHNSEDTSESSVLTQEAYQLAPLVYQIRTISRCVSNYTTSRSCFALANQLQHNAWYLERKIRPKLERFYEVLYAESGPVVESEIVPFVEHQPEGAQYAFISVYEPYVAYEHEQSQSYSIDAEKLQSDEENERMLNSLQTTTVVLSKQDSIQEVVAKITKSVYSQVDLDDKLLANYYEELPEESYKNETSDESIRSRFVESCQPVALEAKTVIESPERLKQMVSSAFEDAIAYYRVTYNTEMLGHASIPVHVVYVANSVVECNERQVPESCPSMINSATAPDDSDVKVYTAKPQQIQVHRVDISGSLAESKPLQAEDVVRYYEQLEKIYELQMKLSQDDYYENYYMMARRYDSKYSPRPVEVHSEPQKLYNSVEQQVKATVKPDDILEGLKSLEDIFDSPEVVVNREIEYTDVQAEAQMDKPVHIVSQLSQEQIFETSDGDAELFEELPLNVQDQQIQNCAAQDSDAGKQLEATPNDVCAYAQGQQIHYAFYVEDGLSDAVKARYICDEFVSFVQNYQASPLNAQYFVQNHLLIDIILQVLGNSGVGVFANAERISSVEDMLLFSNYLLLQNVHFEPLGSGLRYQKARSIIENDIADFAYDNLMKVIMARKREEDAVFSAFEAFEALIARGVERSGEGIIEQVAQSIADDVVADAVSAILR